MCFSSDRKSVFRGYFPCHLVICGPLSTSYMLRFTFLVLIKVLMSANADSFLVSFKLFRPLARQINADPSSDLG